MLPKMPPRLTPAHVAFVMAPRIACIIAAWLVAACANFTPLEIAADPKPAPAERCRVVASSNMEIKFRRSGAFFQSIGVHVESLDGLAAPWGRPCHFTVRPGRHVAVYHLQSWAPFSGSRDFGPYSIAFDAKVGMTYTILSVGPLPPSRQDRSFVWVYEVETGRTVAGKAPPGFRHTCEIVAAASHADCQEL